MSDDATLGVMPGMQPGDGGVDGGPAEMVVRRERVSTNVNEVHESQLTFGQKIADRLADMAGSWRFIIAFLTMVALWIVLNAFVIGDHPADPYPFILLNLLLSLMAGLQAPVIMMSQSRQEQRDRIQADADFRTNLKAELEIEQLHVKLDTLRESQWQELVEMQQRQIALLEKQIQLIEGMGRGQSR